MLFSSAAFLFFFLPLTLLFYYASPRHLKNAVLLAASLFFYAYGAAKHLPLLLFSALFNYGIGLGIGKTTSQKGRKALLAFSVFTNLAFLFYYKYSAFFLGLAGISFQAPALPIGISFYTFQAMSYTVDLYRGDATLEKSPLAFATYLCLFPQLIAGPIVRYTDLSEELRSRKHTLAAFADGAFLFAVGLAKKVVLADTLGKLTPLYRENTPTVLFAWLYALGFTLQIYFDFSGYSDMAVGLGRLFGFRFPRNFDYPYIARTVSEFWRRWHITLSSFFKSYVYIPLGGNRKGKIRLVLNLAAVWLLTGLWHGSAFTFLLWGALYGILLIFEKLWGLSLLKKMPPFAQNLVGRCYTLFFVVLGFVLFNADSLSLALRDLGNLFSVGNLPLYDTRSLYYTKSFLPLLLFSAICATPLPKLFSKKLLSLPQKEALPLFGKSVAMAGLLVLSVAFMVGNSFSPFLYFRF